MIVSAIGAAAVAQNEAADAYTAAVQQGQQQLSEGDFAGAIESFTEALRLSSGASGPAYIGRAAARKGLEDYTAAQEDLKNALTYGASDPRVTAAANNLSGEIYIELGSYSDAMADLQLAVEADPANPLYQFNYGKVMVIAGAPVQGAEALTNWLEADPETKPADSEKDAEAYRLRAQANAQQSKFDEAMGDITASLAIEPDSYESYSLKGLILGVQEEFEQAAEAYSTAIAKFEPAEGSDLPYVDGYMQKASALEEAAKRLTDDPDRQREIYEQAREVSQDLLDQLPERQDVAGVRAAMLFRRGVAERLLENLSDAVKSFSDALDINPQLAQAYFRRGICYFHLGEEHMAIKDFDQAASIDYNSPLSALWKGRTYAQLGEHYEAIKAYGEALAVSDRWTDAYVNRGLTYVQLSEYGRAINDFNDAIRLQPTNGDYYYYRGVAYAKQGNSERAIRSLAKAIDYKEDLADAYLVLADELEKIGQSAVAGEYRARGNELSNQVSK